MRRARQQSQTWSVATGMMITITTLLVTPIVFLLLLKVFSSGISFPVLGGVIYVIYRMVKGENR